MRKSILFALVITLSPPVMATLTVGFSPATTDQQSALEVVLSTINGAKRSVDVAAYSFTSKPIAAALVAAKNRGVSVRVVADEKANNDRYTAVTFLANQSVPVRLNARYAIMHNKFMVVDGDTVQTGSFNYTASAKEGANKRGNSSRLTQSFHFFMFEPIFSPVNALNQPI